MFAMSMVFLSGLVCIALALMKIGRFIYYTPYSVVSGFMCGIGVIIILLEIPPMLGFATPNSVIGAIKQIPYDIMHEKPHALIVCRITMGNVFYNFALAAYHKETMVAGTFVRFNRRNKYCNTSLTSMTLEYIASMPVGVPHLYWPDFTRFGDMIGGAFCLGWALYF